MSKAKTKFVSILTAAVIAVTSVPVFAMTADTGILMLVNENHRIDRDYKPETIGVNGTSYQMIDEAAASLERMLKDMKKELGAAPMIVSTYRSYEHQERVFGRDVTMFKGQGMTEEEAIEKAKLYIALPGASEHQTALAVDLSNDGTLEENFIDSEAGLWIKENCHKYGYVVRYPKEKVEITKINYEPWHLRYLGQPYSDLMFQNDWCLEEFIENMKTEGSMVWDDGNNIWTMYFVKNPIQAFDSNTTVLNTNSGGYIVTTRKAKDMLITVHKGNEKLNTQRKNSLLNRLNNGINNKNQG